MVSLLVAQSTLWSFSSQVDAEHPSTAQVGYSHSNAVCWEAFGRRPRWATPTTCSPWATTAARNGSPVSIRSRTAYTATGPKPAISHTSPASARPRNRAARSMRTTTLARVERRLPEDPVRASSARASAPYASEPSRRPSRRASANSRSRMGSSHLGQGLEPAGGFQYLPRLGDGRAGGPGQVVGRRTLPGRLPHPALRCSLRGKPLHRRRHTLDRRRLRHGDTRLLGAQQRRVESARVPHQRVPHNHQADRTPQPLLSRRAWPRRAFTPLSN